MAGNKCHDVDKLMTEHGFQNLVKGIQAQNISKIALYGVIERRWKMLIARLPESDQEHISTFVQCLKDKHIRRVYICSKDKQIGCGHANCETLLTTLMKLSNVIVFRETTGNATDTGIKHCGTEMPVPEYDDIGIIEQITSQSDEDLSYSDSCFNTYWQLAKLFLDVSTDDDIPLRGGLDSLSLIKLMKNCRLFEFKNSDYIYDQILGDIQILVYAPNLKISNEQLIKVFQNLEMLLNHWKDSYVSCSDAITDIKQLDLSVVDCNQIEYKLLVKNVLEIIESVLNLDKIEIESNENQTRLSKWSVSKIHISSLLEQVNEILSAPEPDEASEMKEENDNLKKEMQILKQQLESNSGDAIKENRKLKQTVKKCEKDICIARLQLMNNIDRIYYEGPFYPKYLQANKMQVTCFGSFQDVIVKLDGISILFDPLEGDLFDDLDNQNYLRRYLHEIDVVLLSTCMNSFTETTVKEIMKRSPRVKWLITSERKNCLIDIGVDENSIITFGIWEEKSVSLRKTAITFACTPTSINRASSQGKMCNDCSWIIKGPERTFYFSGITNYNATHFKEIGKRYHPIHMALLPVADRLTNMSCLPEFTISTKEVVDMHVDLQSKQSLGIRNLYWSHMPTREYEIRKQMEVMQLERSQFVFMERGKAYCSM